MQALLCAAFVCFLIRPSSTSTKACSDQDPFLRPKITGDKATVGEFQPLEVKCSHVVDKNSPAKLTWTIYKKEGGYLVFSLVDPNDRTITQTSRIVRNNCSREMVSSLKLTVTKRVHRAHLACFTRDVRHKPQPCLSTDTTCTESLPVLIKFGGYHTNCLWTIGIVGGLVVGWAILVIPLVVMFLWNTTRTLIDDHGDEGNMEDYRVELNV